MSVNFRKSMRFSARVVAGMLIAACAIMLAACSDDEKDPITIRIYSYNSPYTASYMVNGGTAVDVSGGDPHTSLYYGEFTLAEVNQIEVSVTTTLDTAKFLAVRVYRDGVKVKEGLSSSDSGAALTVNLTYTYDEEDVSEGE